MNDAIPFMSPRLIGERFSSHSIPLEVLKDLAVLEEMIVETAKWQYLIDHTDRKRTPRGFTDGISLRLTGVEEGSAIPTIALFLIPFGLGVVPPENQQYFEKARSRIVEAVSAAEQSKSITEHLPENLLGYFDRIGRSLREGEAIEFNPENARQPARLDKTTRRRLLLASSQVQVLTEEVVLRGSIPEADQAKMTFDLQTIGGARVKAPLNAQHLETVLDAFNGFRHGTRVLLKGIGRYNRHEHLQEIEDIEHISLLDDNDVAARLDEFRLMKNGWLDGKGSAPSGRGLDWLTQRFETLYLDSLPLPYLYPTAEGGVQAEWSVNRHELSLDIDVDAHHGEWHDLNMDSMAETTKTLALDNDDAWLWLGAQIQELTEAAGK